MIVAIEPSSPKSTLQIEWFISKKCNFNCSYCSEYVHNKDGTFPDLATMKSTMDMILRNTKKNITIALTGGEPTLCKHIIEFFKYLKTTYKDRIENASLTTNGSRSTKFYKELCMYLDDINFSYHMEYHATEMIHKTIEELKSSRPSCKLKVHMMMLPTQFAETQLQVEKFREHGIETSVRRIRPVFDKKDLENGIQRFTKPFEDTTSTFLFTEYDPTTGKGTVDWSQDAGYYSEEEEDILDNIIIASNNNTKSFRKENEIITSTLENVNDILANRENIFTGWLCWAGISSLRIQDNGEIYNAACRNKKLGDIYNGFTMLDYPHTCTRNACVCAADINITKIKDLQYKDLIHEKDKL